MTLYFSLVNDAYNKFGSVPLLFTPKNTNFMTHTLSLTHTLQSSRLLVRGKRVCVCVQWGWGWGWVRGWEYVCVCVICVTLIDIFSVTLALPITHISSAYGVRSLGSPLCKRTNGMKKQARLTFQWQHTLSIRGFQLFQLSRFRGTFLESKPVFYSFFIDSKYSHYRFFQITFC
jgi:hypothetical protein